MDGSQSEMDLKDCASKFDDALQRALEDLDEGFGEDPPAMAGDINTEIAKSADDWAILLKRPTSATYAILQRRVSQGKWRRVAASEPGVRGRKKYYYYPADRDPYLSNQGCSE